MNKLFSDIQSKLVDSDTDNHQFDLIEYQHVPDEFYEENRLMREASKLVPIGEMHMYCRPPVHTWKRLKKLYPGLQLDKPTRSFEAAKERANAVIRALEAMDEHRCITTVHRNL